MRNSSIFAALLTASALAVPAQAQTTAATATTTGTFSQVYVGAGDTNPVYAGVGTNQITFGIGLPGWTITYTPSGPVNYSTTPFYLGSITAYNGSVNADSGISGLNLHLTTVIDPAVNPGGDGLGTLDELITIFATLNSEDPIASADYLGFESLSLGAWIKEGQQASFDLFGTVNSPLTLSNIVVAEGSEESGFVTEIDPYPFQITPVPESATWAMMMLGFGLVGAAIRRVKPAASLAAA